MENKNIAESFDYCGISSTDQLSYHRDLKKILVDNIIPSYSSIEVMTEEEKDLGYAISYANLLCKIIIYHYLESKIIIFIYF